MGRWLLLVVCLVCAAACGGVPATLRGSAGRWVKLETEHFDLYTDLGDADAGRAAEALERTRGAILTAAWSKDVGSKRTSRAAVVVLGDGLAFEHYMGRSYTGVFSSLVRPTIILWGPPERWERRQALGDETTTSVLRHELVHRLAAGVYGRQPRWFSEGLAQFLEAIVVSEDGKSAVLGRPNMVALRKYKRFRSLGARDALAWQGDVGKNDLTLGGLYGLSWLMVHWLYNTHFDAFAVFQTKLAKGEEPGVAWSDAFGSLDLDQMDRDLFQYSQHGDFKEIAVQLDPVDAGVMASPLSQASEHALRGQLALVGAAMQKKDDLKAEARSELAQALALEPANVLALRTRKESDDGGSGEELLSRLREQVRARPDDGDAWLLLSEVLARGGPTDEREVALRRAIALLPADSSPFNNLAWLLVTSGRGGEALPFAIKATMLAPWDAVVVDTYAACLFAVGRCPEALKAETRAIDLIPEHKPGERQRGGYDGRLARYREACGRGPDTKNATER